MNKYYDPEFKARAVRLVQQQRDDYPSMTAVCRAIGDELGVSRETLRNWARQADIDAGEVPGVTTGENDEIRRLRTENKRLRESNEILKSATVFFAGELDPKKPLIIGFIDQMRSQGYGSRVDLPSPSASRAWRSRRGPTDTPNPPARRPERCPTRNCWTPSTD